MHLSMPSPRYFFLRDYFYPRPSRSQEVRRRTHARLRPVSSKHWGLRHGNGLLMLCLWRTFYWSNWFCFSMFFWKCIQTDSSAGLGWRTFLHMCQGQKLELKSILGNMFMGISWDFFFYRMAPIFAFRVVQYWLPQKSTNIKFRCPSSCHIPSICPIWWS